GPNGADKTTKMLMLLGLIHPSRGNAKVFNDSAEHKTHKEKRGVMLQDVSLMDGLRVRDILHLLRSYYTDPLSLNELIDITGLSDEEVKKRTEKLSGAKNKGLPLH